LMLASSLGLLGRTRGVRGVYDYLVITKKGFSTNARKHIEFFTPDENLVNKILKGYTRFPGIIQFYCPSIP